MSLISEIQRDMQEAHEADFPCVVRWQGRNFPASRSSCRRQHSYEIGGEILTVTLSVAIRQNAEGDDRTLFSAVAQPALGNEITVDGTVRVIVGVDDGHGAFTTLELHDPNAGK